MRLSEGQFRLTSLEARPRWFGHEQARDSGHVGQNVLNMELAGRRNTTEEVLGCRGADVMEEGDTETDYLLS